MGDFQGPKGFRIGEFNPTWEWGGSGSPPPPTPSGNNYCASFSVLVYQTLFLVIDFMDRQLFVQNHQESKPPYKVNEPVA